MHAKSLWNCVTKCWGRLVSRGINAYLQIHLYICVKHIKGKGLRNWYLWRAQGYTDRKLTRNEEGCPLHTEPHDTRGWNTKTIVEELTSAETMGKAGAGFCRRRLSDHPGSGTLPGTWKVDTWIESLSLEHRLPHNPVFTIIKKSSKNLTASRGLSHSSMTPKNWWKKYRLVEWILVSELKGSHSEERWLISNSRRKESKGTKQRRNLKNV